MVMVAYTQGASSLRLVRHDDFTSLVFSKNGFERVVARFEEHETIQALNAFHRRAARMKVEAAHA